MTRWMVVVFGLTITGGVGLLGLAVWPGLLENVVFSLLICAWLPLLGVWFLLLVGLGLRDFVSKLVAPGNRCWWGAASAMFMFGTIGLLRFHVPQRITFAFCYSDLRELVDKAPTVETGQEIGRQVGPYWVDRYAAHPRGGVYFRTATGPDGIGPDTTSYGFAFRPNDIGTPFGWAHYQVVHLFSDWYVFSASDDYYD